MPHGSPFPRRGGEAQGAHVVVPLAGRCPHLGDECGGTLTPAYPLTLIAKPSDSERQLSPGGREGGGGVCLFRRYRVLTPAAGGPVMNRGVQMLPTELGLRVVTRCSADRPPS